MKPIERIIHSLIYEAIALVLTALLAVFATGKGVVEMTGLAALLSLIAMSWNYVFNIIFDKIFGSNRIDRTALMRLVHGISYEAGMIVFTFPTIMIATGKDFLTVLALDIGIVFFFVVYAIAYNWVYDVVRYRLFCRKDQSGEKAA